MAYKKAGSCLWKRLLPKYALHNRPEFSRYDVEGKEWIMEGYGVDPDIVVDNDPAREFEGIDDQLNKGIETIHNDLKTKKQTLPDPPKYPNKSK